MAGCAFSIEDALIAVRWAGQIRSRGYHVVITPRYGNADEVIEVCIPDTTKPTFKVHRATNSVLITDCIGLTLSFPTLTDALLAMAPLPKRGQREMLKGASPAWLPAFPAQSTREAGNCWSRAARSVLSVAATWSNRYRRERAEPV
jgi:hypothetical protein